MEANSQAATDSLGSPGFAFPDLECPAHLPKYYRDDEDRKVKLEIFKDSPFLNLLNYSSKQNSCSTFKFISLLYNPKKEAFFVEGKCLKLCATEAAHVLGMKNEGTKFTIPETTTYPPLPDYYFKCSGQNFVSKPTLASVLTNMIINDDNKEDFKKIMYVYLYTYIFAIKSTKRQLGSPGFQLVEDIAFFEKINWVEVILTKVMHYVKELEGFEKSGKNMKKMELLCFTPLLEAWFYYRTHSRVEKIILKDDVSKVPLHFYTSELRMDTLQRKLQANKFKQRCIVCKDAESELELELEHEAAKLEHVATNSEGGVVLEIAPRIFRIETHCCFEEEHYQISEEIGHKVLEFCLEGSMAYASSLGLTESSADLMEMMRAHVEPEQNDSWTLVETFLKYKPDAEERDIGDAEHEKQPHIGDTEHEEQPDRGDVDQEKQPVIGDIDHEKRPHFGDAEHEKQPDIGDAEHEQQPHIGDADQEQQKPDGDVGQEQPDVGKKVKKPLQVGKKVKKPRTQYSGPRRTSERILNLTANSSSKPHM